MNWLRNLLGHRPDHFTMDRQVVLPGKIRLDLCHCPAGSFMMGSPAGEVDRNADEVQHQVILTKPFWLGKTPVTRGQWQTVMSVGTICCDEAVNQPISKIYWHQAVAFCKKLMTQEQAANRLPAGYEYRLPTEAEWEYACRTGGIRSVADSDDQDWPAGNRADYLVGKKPPNAWGLHDMLGNAGEWCHDWYAAYPPATLTDPAGPMTGTVRVCRGGIIGNENGSVTSHRIATRARFDPNVWPKDFHPGFRVALAPALGEPWENAWQRERMAELFRFVCANDFHNVAMCLYKWGDGDLDHPFPGSTFPITPLMAAMCRDDVDPNIISELSGGGSDPYQEICGMNALQFARRAAAKYGWSDHTLNYVVKIRLMGAQKRAEKALGIRHWRKTNPTGLRV
jgi:formylglycine-generating enzyme required for sulfatase activity